jgi:hypothetical protein
MSEEIATSYYEELPDSKWVAARLLITRGIRYWKLIPLLKIVNARRYKREAELLLNTSQIQGFVNRVPIRYKVEGGLATFEISSDFGKTYLSYLTMKIDQKDEYTTLEFINSIATIEAIIKTRSFYNQK